MEKLPIKIQLNDSFFEEETKCGYLVSSNIKQLWAVLLDLMVEFDAVCKEHGIKYSLEGGTLLGAIRHKGFIPWDDDADIIMLRPEFEKLCKIAPTAFKAPYFWQTNETDPGSMRRHAQLRNSATTCILCYEMEKGVPKYGFNQGAFLDVFIWDEVPDNEEERLVFCNQLEKFAPVLDILKDYYWKSGETPLLRELQHQASVEFGFIASRYNGTNQKRVGNVSLLIHPDKKMLLPREMFEDLIEYPFEGYHFSIPRDYRTMLTAYFGDWHQLIISGSMHGQIFANMTTPYVHYISKQGIRATDKAYMTFPVWGLCKKFANELSQKNKKIQKLRRQRKWIGITLGVMTLSLISVITYMILL